MVCGFPEKYSFSVRSLEPEFQPVLDAMKKNFKKGLERGAQFVVYHRGKKVVDITGHTKSILNKGYSPDSMQIVFSSGKTIASFAIAWLVQQGRLDYDKPVADYWPEFAANGKETILLKDVLRHDSGLAFLSTPITTEMMLERPPTAIGKAIEESEPAWKYVQNLKEGDRIYHAASRGLILNEICRRVDEKQRNIGQILTEVLNKTVTDVVQPDGPDENSQPVFMFCGKHNISPSELESLFPNRYFAHHFESIPNALRNKFIRNVKYAFGATVAQRYRKTLPNDVVDLSKRLIAEGKKQNVKSITKNTLKGVALGDILRDPDSMLELDTPSATVVSNADGLAAYGAAFVLADPSKRILNDETLEKFLSDPVSKYDFFHGKPTCLSTGGVGYFKDAMYPEFMHSFVGWHGYGGSGFAFSPEYEISVAYVPNRYNVFTVGGFFDPRSLRIMEALMGVIRRSNNPKETA